ncbi:MAG: 4a-hydroxytetrahydrobiopterin dehydratase [Gammaproteobacteria bacterium]
MAILEQKPSLPSERMNKPLDQDTIENFLSRLGDGWQLSSNQKEIIKDFYFKNYYQAIAFVNAIAWMTHFENHHPNLEVGFNHCLVRYTTLAIDGLSENDFICAKKINHLFQSYEDKLHE